VIEMGPDTFGQVLIGLIVLCPAGKEAKVVAGKIKIARLQFVWQQSSESFWLKGGSACDP